MRRSIVLYLVAGEVVAGLGPQQDEHLLHRGGRFPLGPFAVGGGPRDVVDVLEQFGGQFFGRGHVIDQAGVDGAAGHSVILGRGRVLHHGHPQVLLDGLQTQGAVAAHAGQQNADGLFLLVGRQVPEEEVDGHPQAPGRGRFQYLELSVQDGQVGVGRNHVDVIGLDLDAIRCLDDLHLGVPAEKFRHHALVGRLQVGHQDERQPGVRGQVGEELPEGLQSTRRAAHAHDVEGGPIAARCRRLGRVEGGRFCRLPGAGLFLGFLHGLVPVAEGRKFAGRFRRRPRGTYFLSCGFLLLGLSAAASTSAF